MKEIFFCTAPCATPICRIGIVLRFLVQLVINFLFIQTTVLYLILCNIHVVTSFPPMQARILDAFAC